MKKLSKKIIPCLLAGLTTLTTAACASNGNNKNSGDKGYEIITDKTEYVVSEDRTPLPLYTKTFSAIGGEGVMPIGVFYGPFTTSSSSFTNCEQDVNFITDKYFRLIKESGCNFTAVSPDVYRNYQSNQKISLDLSAKYGLGYFVNDNSRLDYLEEYIYHPACMGIHLQDEPRASDFAYLTKVIDKFRTYDIGDKSASCNLLPIYGLAYGGDQNLFANMTYEEYVKHWMDIADIDFVSFDHYVFIQKDKTIYTSVQYFQNMSLFRKEAQAHEIPFWVYMETGCQWNEGSAKDTEYPLYPNEEEFLWKVNTSLAYGAKGMQYFTYIQPEHFTATMDPDVKDYEKNGMVGYAGNINRWYYYVQKANKQIAAIDHVLMNAMNVGVIPIGELANKLTYGLPEVIFGPFRELQSVSGDDVFVGCFDYKGKTALYVVSNSITEKQNITLNFNNKYGYDVIQRGVSVEVAAQNLPLTLEKGEGVLVVLK